MTNDSQSKGWRMLSRGWYVLDIKFIAIRSYTTIGTVAIRRPISIGSSTKINSICMLGKSTEWVDNWKSLVLILDSLRQVCDLYAMKKVQLVYTPYKVIFSIFYLSRKKWFSKLIGDDSIRFRWNISMIP